VRQILLPAIVSCALLALRGDAGANDPLFPSREGGGQLTVRAVRGMVKRKARAGIDEETASRISPHWLRHEHASHAIDGGASLPEVQETLGHGNVATTEGDERDRGLPDGGPRWPPCDLADKSRFKAWLEPLYHTKWRVYAKRPFAGPEQVLAYLARYTHRVAISNRRLLKADASGVTFSYKDYRIEGPGRYKTMTLAPGEFIRRLMLHVLPKGFHGIRHYGLLARSRSKAETLIRARKLIAVATPVQATHKQVANDDAAMAPDKPEHPCPRCGGPIRIIEMYRHRPSAATDPPGLDTS
jgi:Putative transposase/Phage integrase family